MSFLKCVTFFMKARKKIRHNYLNHLSISYTLKFHPGTSFLETAPWSMNSLCLILNSGQLLYLGCFLWNGFSDLFSLTQIVNIYRVPHTCRKAPLKVFTLLIVMKIKLINIFKRFIIIKNTKHTVNISLPKFRKTEIVIHILQLRKVSLSKVKWLIQSHAINN